MKAWTAFMEMRYSEKQNYKNMQTIPKVDSFIVTACVTRKEKTIYQKLLI